MLSKELKKLLKLLTCSGFIVPREILTTETASMQKVIPKNKVYNKIKKLNHKKIKNNL